MEKLTEAMLWKMLLSSMSMFPSHYRPANQLQVGLGLTPWSTVGALTSLDTLVSIHCSSSIHLYCFLLILWVFLSPSPYHTLGRHILSQSLVLIPAWHLLPAPPSTLCTWWNLGLPLALKDPDSVTIHEQTACRVIEKMWIRSAKPQRSFIFLLVVVRGVTIYQNIKILRCKNVTVGNDYDI